MVETLKIANSLPMWLACSLVVIVELIQAALFIRAARKEADCIGFPKAKLNGAIKDGAVTAIGPALAGLVVMVSMMAVIGGPITWSRLSVIGAAQTELTVADVAASAMGTSMGAADYGVKALTLCALLMGLNGCGWMLTTTIFTPNMETVRHKISGGDMKWLALLTAGSTLGLFSHLCSAQVVKNVSGGATAALVAFATQFIIDNWIAKKAKWIKSYAITIALILGVVVAALVCPV